jgi:hypothetical protein
MIKCWKCGETKPDNMFYAKRKACKKCVDAQHMEYREKDRENHLKKENERFKRYYQENKTMIQEKQRLKYQENPEEYEKIKAYNRKYQEELRADPVRYVKQKQYLKEYREKKKAQSS